MTEQVVHTRKDDAGLQKWLPILVPVLAVGIAWGEQRMAREHQEQAIVEVKQLVKENSQQTRVLSDAAIARETRVRLIESDLAEAKLAVSMLAEIAAKTGKIEGRLEAMDHNVDSLWDLVRRNEARLKDAGR